MENKNCGECRKFKSLRCGDCRESYPACSAFEPKPTNGDHIRQMSNEELAIEFATLTDCGNCDDCPVKDYCTTDCCDPIPAWLAYLNTPAESEVGR